MKKYVGVVGLCISQMLMAGFADTDRPGNSSGSMRYTAVERTQNNLQNLSLNNEESNDAVRVAAVDPVIQQVMDALNDRVDPDTALTELEGLITKYRQQQQDIDNIKDRLDSFNASVMSISTGLSEQATTLTTIASQITELYQKNTDQDVKIAEIAARLDYMDATMDDRWNTFIETKFAEYIEIKKKVLAILAECDIKGIDRPTLITETAEDLVELDFDTRRTVLTGLLERLHLFDTLLNNEKLEVLQTYLDQTNVPQPKLFPIYETLQYYVDGDYIKITGDTKEYIRKVLKTTGMPKRDGDGLDQNYDWYPFGEGFSHIRPIIESESSRRSKLNVENTVKNKILQAKYKAARKNAESIAFPSETFNSVVTDHNCLIVHHDI